MLRSLATTAKNKMVTKQSINKIKGKNKLNKTYKISTRLLDRIQINR